jgi:tetratricopeptide (TPR) repeat protein
MLGNRMLVPRRLSLPLVLSLVASTAPAPVRAEPSPAPNVVAARKHYDRARAFYEQGAYREAVGELDAAHTLDPSAKDLVFNLGVVHEKLGDIDDALQWFRLYAGMHLSPQESDRAEAYVRRLEGAERAEREKHEHDEETAHRPTTAETPTTPAPEAAPPPPAPEARPVEPTRFDALTLTSGGVAAVGIIAGTVLGVKALSDQPGSSYVTGRDGTYEDLVHQVDRAHGEAVAADIAFGVAAVAGLACAYFYWLRPHASASVGATTVSAAPIQSGLAFVLRGTL